MPSSSSGAEMHSTIQQEEFSYAFISTIVSAAGYAMQPPTRPIDNSGIDITVTAPGRIGAVQSPRFDAQVKCIADSSFIKKTQINYPLNVRNYQHLINPESHVSQLLILVFVPKEVSTWVKSTEENTILQKCVYWMSLKGNATTQNTDNITVHIPRQHLLTPASLQGIMQRVAGKEL
jgi:Domain of unknown function (DUF4365)